jgi:hypothetical protein
MMQDAQIAYGMAFTTLVGIIMMVIIVIGRMRWVSERAPYRGRIGWYQRGTRGRISHRKAMKEYFICASVVAGTCWGVISFLSGLTSPATLVLDVIGNLLKIVSGGNLLVSLAWAVGSHAVSYLLLLWDSSID